MVNERYLKYLEKKKNKSISNYDSLGYFTACNELGQDPELVQLYCEGQLIFEMNKKARNKLEKIAKLNETIESIKKMKKLNPNSIFDYTQEKCNYIIKDLGYKNLNANTPSKRELTTDASNSKVGLVFQNNYNTLLNKVDKLIEELGI